MPVNPRMFAAHCALARTLARLGPFYRDRTVAAVASAFADRNGRMTQQLRPILCDEDLVHACAKAVRILKARDVTAFDRAIARWKSAVVSSVRCCRRVLKRQIHKLPPC
jgi:hypothetical protein